MTGEPQGVLHRIADDIDAQDVQMRADVLAGLETLLQRHAEFEEFLRDRS